MFWVNLSDFGLYFPFLGPPLAVRPISVKKHPIRLKNFCTVGATLHMSQKNFQPERTIPGTLFARRQRITRHDKTISTFYGLKCKKVLTLYPIDLKICHK